MTSAYFNEIDPFAAEWLRRLYPSATVDARSIVDVPADDVPLRRAHFFAGIAGWEVALELAGWPADRSVWTGSCPCQPFSLYGNRQGVDDERHLWPAFFRLIRERRPGVIFGEQVASAVGHGWLDGVFSDLESISYACGAAVVGAEAVGAPHRRERLYWVATDPNGARVERPDKGAHPRLYGPWEWRGKADLCAIADAPFVRGDRWPQPLIRRVDDGLPGRVGRLRAYGNAIVPLLAAEFVRAFMEAEAMV